ncbi:hypothetical protein M0Q28_01580 [Patescibacteria group bacterium]|jgi:hypothetical protein|nr:hypothetical protein [Patescibacteria group bacterium]
MPSIIKSLTIAALASLGISTKLIIPSEVVKALRTTCFRGKELARAGNSCRYNTPEEMVEDPLFLEPFCENALEAIREYWPLMLAGFREVVPFQFAPDTAIGWLPAVEREKVNGAKLHLAKIGEKAQGMMVAVSDVAHPAPRTNLFHLDLAYKVDFNNRSEIAIRILGMGIGQDLGLLEGDVIRPFHVNGEIEPRQLVFFRPDHVGGDTILPLDP